MIKKIKMSIIDYSYINNENFTKIIDNIYDIIKRYEKFSPEIRFLMFMDKLQILISSFKILNNASISSAINKIKSENIDAEEKKEKIQNIMNKNDQLNTVFDLIKKELDSFEVYIQSDTKSILTNIDKKLDEVLLGPYYKAGLE